MCFLFLFLCCGGGGGGGGGGDELLISSHIIPDVHPCLICRRCVGRGGAAAMPILIATALAASRTIVSIIREQSIQFRLQGEGGLVLPFFLPLTIKPLYGMLVKMGLYRDL